MGVCCTNNYYLRGEEVVQNVFSEMKLSQMTLNELEVILKEHCDEKSMISHDQLCTYIKPYLYNTHHSNEYLIYHEPFLEFIFSKSRYISIYEILLYFFSFVSKTPSETTQIEKFHYLFYNLSAGIGDRYIDLYKYLEDYLNVNLIQTTRIVFAKFRSHYIEQFGLDVMVNEVYTEQNISKYLNCLTKRKSNENILNFKNFHSIFVDKPFIFNFATLRYHFWEFYQNEIRNELII
jgi:hypothetical protein